MKSHALPSTWFVSIVLSCCLGAGVASANIMITGSTGGGSIAGVDSDNDSTVTTIPVTYVAGAPQPMKNALTAQFPTWTFNYAAGLGGKLNINTYMPVSTADDNGGAEIDATYTPAATDPALANLHWIQLVITNAPLGGGPTNGYIDPLPNDDTLPFYYTVPEDSMAADGMCGVSAGGGAKPTGGGTYHFFDCSQRTPPSDTAATNWTGDLMLASWTDPGGNNWLTQPPPAANQTVTVYDGVQWGWTLVDVPEPDSLVLLLAGLVAVGLRRMLSKGDTNAGLLYPR